jgi:hypothetical protein
LHEIIATTTIAILMIGVQGEIDGNIWTHHRRWGNAMIYKL